MAFKLIIALAVVAAVSAGFIPQHQQPHQLYHAQPVYHAAPVQHVPVVHKVLTKTVEEYDPHPQYKFSYGVDDKLTGDNHGHHEERDGDSVHGEYFLIDSDGYKRTVTYTADAHSGFNAVVHREPLTKVAHVAPVTHYSHAPESAYHAAAPSYYHH